MTDEAFWKRMEEEVLPHVKQNHEEYERFWNDKIQEIKELNFETHYDLAYHQWMTIGCYLRNFYWEGLQVKSLIEFCAVKCGEAPDKIKV
jgi:hypothetical protein